MQDGRVVAESLVRCFRYDLTHRSSRSNSPREPNMTVKAQADTAPYQAPWCATPHTCRVSIVVRYQSARVQCTCPIFDEARRRSQGILYSLILRITHFKQPAGHSVVVAHPPLNAQLTIEERATLSDASLAVSTGRAAAMRDVSS